MKTHAKTQGLLVFILVFILACNLPGGTSFNADQVTATPVEVPGSIDALPSATSTPAVTHLMTPSTSPPAGQIVYDVESSGTALEKRAPYGDSYDINRLERPFLQDMTYVSDLDIVTYTVAQDADWYYVSIELIGTDPNNPLGI